MQIIDIEIYEYLSTNIHFIILVFYKLFLNCIIKDVIIMKKKKVFIKIKIK